MELSAEKEYVGVSAIYQFLGNGVQVIAGSLFYIFAARLFDTTYLGNIALFIAIVGLFSIVFSVGLNTAVTHFISSSLYSPNYSTRSILTKILGLGIILSVLVLIIVFSLSDLISFTFFHNVSDSIYVKLLSIVLMGNILFSILNGAILGFQRFRASAIISVVIWVTYYFGSLVFAFYFRSLEAIIFGWIGGMAIGIFVDITYLLLIALKKRLERKHTVPGSRAIFIYSLPILLSALISYGASYTDRFVVAYLLNTSFLGIYNFSLLIFSGISFISAPFNNITLPKFSQFFGQGDRENIKESVKSASLLLTFVYTPIALGIAALSPLILYFIAGPAYVIGSSALIIVMFLPSLVVIQNILTQAIASVRKTKFFLYSSVASLSLNVLLSFLLIPKFGLAGAAVGFSSVYLASFAMLYWLARKESLVKLNLKGMTKIWISSIIMFIAVYYSFSILYPVYGFSPSMLPLLILEGIIIFLIVVRYMKVFSQLEKEFIRSLFPDHMKLLRFLIDKFILN